MNDAELLLGVVLLRKRGDRQRRCGDRCGRCEN
jgi:hypothetical protein